MYFFASFDTCAINGILLSEENLRTFERWLSRPKNMAVLPMEVVTEIALNRDLTESARRMTEINRLKARQGEQKIFIPEGVRKMHCLEYETKVTENDYVAYCMSFRDRDHLLGALANLQWRRRTDKILRPMLTEFLAQKVARVLDQKAKKAFADKYSPRELIELAKQRGEDPDEALENSVWLVETLLGNDENAKKILAGDYQASLNLLAFCIAGDQNAVASVTRVELVDRPPFKDVHEYHKNNWVDARILSQSVRCNCLVTDDDRLFALSKFVARALKIESRFHPMRSSQFLAFATSP
jgi:hypothetical protein